MATDHMIGAYSAILSLLEFQGKSGRKLVREFVRFVKHEYCIPDKDIISLLSFRFGEELIKSELKKYHEEQK